MKLVTKHYCYSEEHGPFKEFDKGSQTVTTDMTNKYQNTAEDIEIFRFLYVSMCLPVKGLLIM